MKTKQATVKSAYVSFIVQPDGEVWATATGQHGSLQLELSSQGPTIAIQDPARPGKYKACWALQANGHLIGWLVDENDRIKYFPERKKPKRAKSKPKQKQTTKAPPLRGKAQRQSK